jgi:hypothetical protein
MITDAGADFTRESSRDAWIAAPQTSQSREQSQNALLVQAARATMDFQQLQWDCQALNCGLSDSTYESLVETCRALPVSDRLDLLNAQLEVLRQRRANHASRQVVPQVHQRPAPSVTNDDSRSLQHANYADVPTSAPSVTPAANAHVFAAPANAAPANAVTPAANAAPTVEFTGRKRTLDRLIRLATRAYQGIVVRFREHGPTAHVGREEICAMLGDEDGAQFKKDLDAGYLSRKNIIAAAGLQDLSAVVIYKGRDQIHKTATTDENCAAFERWVIAEMARLPARLKTKVQIVEKLKQAWEASTARPVITSRRRRGGVQACDDRVWNFIKIGSIKVMDLYHAEIRAREGGDSGGRVGEGGDGNSGGGAAAAPAPAAAAAAACGRRKQSRRHDGNDVAAQGTEKHVSAVSDEGRRRAGTRDGGGPGPGMETGRDEGRRRAGTRDGGGPGRGTEAGRGRSGEPG